MAPPPLKMRLTHKAILELEALAAVLGEPSGPLVARRMILASLGLGGPLGPLPEPLIRLPPSRRRNRADHDQPELQQEARPGDKPGDKPDDEPDDQPTAMGQIVMRLPADAYKNLAAIAAERGLESPAITARAILIDAMANYGLTVVAVNPIDRTRRETTGLSRTQGDAIRLITRLAILIDQVEAIARNWRDQDLLGRAQQSRLPLGDAVDRLRRGEPDQAAIEHLKANGHTLNGYARRLHAGEPIERHRNGLSGTLDQMNMTAEALCPAS